SGRCGESGCGRGQAGGVSVFERVGGGAGLRPRAWQRWWAVVGALVLVFAGGGSASARPVTVRPVVGQSVAARAVVGLPVAALSTAGRPLAALPSAGRRLAGQSVWA